MAENAMKKGHKAGTEAPEDIQKPGDARTAKDTKSSALAFTPRLLDLKASAHYLSIGVWTIRELVWAGKLPTVKVPRANGDGDLDKILLDRNDLDAFIAGLPREFET